MTDRLPIYIAFSTNDTYIPYLDVCLRSLIDYADEKRDYCIFILYSKISDDNKQKIKKQEDKNISISFVNVQSSLSKVRENTFFVNNHLTIETYFRFFLPDIFPQLDKILYLDCDILIQKDIADLYQTNIDGFYLGATRDLGIVLDLNKTKEKRINYFTQTLNLTNPYDYFQAGCLLFNLKEMRKDNVSHLLIEKLKQVKNPMYHDQCILNATCKDKVFFFQQNWNFTWHIYIAEPCWEKYLGNTYRDIYLNAKTNPFIIHYTGGQIKPINYPQLPESKKFWKYALQSVYYDYLWEQLITAYNKKVQTAIKETPRLVKYKILEKIMIGSSKEKWKQKYQRLYQKLTG
ncbi:MAG: glycosyltransferase family 8 protein [Alphaproteobacteria bacterium]|nr:glycosyltransferase family 8 protein [Alphaproteobacteria bacterium]